MYKVVSVVGVTEWYEMMRYQWGAKKNKQRMTSELSGSGFSPTSTHDNKIKSVSIARDVILLKFYPRCPKIVVGCLVRFQYDTFLAIVNNVFECLLQSVQRSSFILGVQVDGHTLRKHRLARDWPNNRLEDFSAL
jgi:hypothetical protein